MPDNYSDDDDEPLGRWERVDCATRERMVAEAGGLESLSVFSAYAEIDVRVDTDWGREGQPTPLVSDRMEWDETGERTCTHWAFAPTTLGDPDV